MTKMQDPVFIFFTLVSWILWTFGLKCFSATFTASDLCSTLKSHYPYSDFFFFFPRVTRCRSCLYQVYVFLSLFLLIIFITFALIHLMLQSNRSGLCCMLTKGFYVLSVLLYTQEMNWTARVVQGLKVEFRFYMVFILHLR